ncbi:MAG: hypothetical protein ACFFCV_11665 [Promethearchaeota archaeon]
MGEDKNLIKNNELVEEIKKEIIQCIEKYIDRKLKPVLNYFQKKKDFYEMSYI